MTDHARRAGPPIVAGLLLAALLGGCGQTGPLTLEDRSAERAQPGPDAATEQREADDESDSSANER